MDSTLGVCLPQSLAHLDYFCLFLNLCIWDHTPCICCVYFTFSSLFCLYAYLLFSNDLLFFKIYLFCLPVSAGLYFLSLDLILVFLLGTWFASPT